MKLITTFCLLLIANFTFAQSIASVDEFTAKGISPDQLTEMNDDSWSFFVDEDSETYFIDFEALKVNLSELLVKDQEGEVIFKDDVFELPVNTIYEIDYSTYEAGDYEVELRSFTGVMRKKITVK